VLKRHEQSEHELSETLSPVGSGTAHKNGNQEVLFTALDHQVLESCVARTSTNEALDAWNLLAKLKKQIS